MPHDAYLAAGLPVGTRIVESACGSVVEHRVGAKASSPNALRMGVVEMLDQFDGVSLSVYTYVYTY